MERGRRRCPHTRLVDRTATHGEAGRGHGHGHPLGDRGAAHVGHAEIDHHQIRPPGLNQLDGLAAARTRDDFETRALGKPRDDFEDSRFVVNDHEQRSLPCHAHSLSPSTAARADRIDRN